MTEVFAPPRNALGYLWFWSFWHWSVESFRSGSLLHDPMHGIAGHWDEWFRHEASAEEQRGIARIGATSRGQRLFVVWLARRWCREVARDGAHVPASFTLGRLAHVPPFNEWAAFSRYRASYGAAAISAIVLAEGSAGEPSDVRSIEALVLPPDAEAVESTFVTEGFHANELELELARQGAMNLLGGSGLLSLSARWLVSGRRPYPRWLATLLLAGWLAIVALIVLLVVGPEPGERLVPMSVALLVLWITLSVTALGVAGVVLLSAWREGQRWRARLATSQVRIRMDGGLTLLGGSAGLPFCLDTLLATYRAESRCGTPSWLWRQTLGRIGADARSWAATGVVTANGHIAPVLLDGKLRAMSGVPHIRALLTPRQPGARSTRDSRAATRVASLARRVPAPSVPNAPGLRRMPIGFAAAAPPIRIAACRSVAQAVFTMASMRSTPQLTTNVLAAAVSIVMIFALPSLRLILDPPRAPMAVAPSSNSDDQLWVSLDTPFPEAFSVSLESGFWTNRRANVRKVIGDNVPARAELSLRRLQQQTSSTEEDGTVWVERRRRFLTREFVPGERVGRYFLSYLFRLPHG